MIEVGQRVRVKKEKRGKFTFNEYGLQTMEKHDWTGVVVKAAKMITVKLDGTGLLFFGIESDFEVVE